MTADSAGQILVTTSSSALHATPERFVSSVAVRPGARGECRGREITEAAVSKWLHAQAAAM